MSGREIVGCIFLIAGGVLFAGVAMLLARARAASGWSSAEGRITASRLDSDLTMDGHSGRSRTYRVSVAYEYEVDGRKLSGKRRAFGESLFGWMGKRDSAKQLHEAYPVGRAVTVHYDPAHPERCTLSRDVDEGRFRNLLVVAALIALAGAGVLAGFVKVEG
jgi:hypothetical protein